MIYRVWAPRAAAVHWEGAGRRVVMARDDRGWWTSPDLLVAEYAFHVDDDGPFPDPRSGAQPHGVHGASATVDHGRFRWTDDGWRPPALAGAVIYELHAGTFTPAGTFDAAIDRLDHLVALGITHVEVMPIAAFAGARGWGYDGVALFAPHHAYGGPDAFKRFVDACHRRGLAVLLDVVYNHLGPSGNYLPRFGPYFTERYRTPWGDALNFDDADSDDVRAFVLDNVRMWIRDYHVDGLRLDAVHAIYDMSAIHLLEAIAADVERLEHHLDRPVLLIAESDLNDPRVVRPRDRFGYGLHAQWSDDFHHAVHACVTGERAGYYEDFGAIADIAAALTAGFVYADRYSAHRRRRHGRPIGDLSAARFVTAIENHDQVGNRARGERLGHLVSPGLARVAAALLLTAPTVPLIFQGQEWGASTPFQYFTDHDEALGALVRDGRRREFAAFGWRPDDIPDPQDPATFERSKLQWQEVEAAAHRRMLEWYRALIALRRSTPALTSGRWATLAEWDEQERWLTFRRDELTIAVNFAAADQEVPLAGAADQQIRLASADEAAIGPNRLWLPAESVAILGR